MLNKGRQNRPQKTRAGLANARLCYRRYTQSKNESMRNRLPLLLIMFLTACASGPDQFSKSLTNEFGLQEYTAVDLDNTNTKVKAAFIYTLLANTEELRIHQFNGAADNEVYVKNDIANGGYPEMVVRFERDENGEKIDGTGVVVRDCENMGSFNYKHPQREPLGHFTQDILPWIKWGNCREDTTTREQRIIAYIMDLELGLERLIANQSGYYLPRGFNFKDSGQSETIAFFIAALESSNFDLYNFIMNEQSSQEKRKDFYKALNQGINNLFVGKV